MSAEAAEAFGATPVGALADLWLNTAARPADPRWMDLQNLSEAARDGIAAGFEFIGRRPGEVDG
jgi:hypothetical protein